MRILVNGDHMETRSPLTVAELIDELGMGNSWLAVAVRGEVVPRIRWAETDLYENDAVEIVRAMTGGH